MTFENLKPTGENCACDMNGVCAFHARNPGKNVHEEKRYIGIDEKGDRYVVREINWDDMTALCQAEEWIGWLRCRFEKFIEVGKK